MAWNADGQTVAGGDLIGQAIQAIENLRIALESVAGTLDDVVKLTIYVVDYTPESRAALVEVFKRYMGTTHPPANTLLGLQFLAREDLMIEIDAVAVID